MSSVGRVNTRGELRALATTTASVERATAEDIGRTYAEGVGNGPYTTWTGRAVWPFWLDKDASVNSSLGRQAQNYPHCYKPTRFIYEKDMNWTGSGNW